MKKISIALGCVLLFCLTTAVIISMFVKGQPVDYLERFGVRQFMEAESAAESEIVSKDGFLYKYYDGLCVVYNDKGRFAHAEITGEQYRYGKIGVGSSRAYVEKKFKNKPKIVDLKNNEFGFIEGEQWIYFSFKDDLADKITIAIEF